MRTIDADKLKQHFAWWHEGGEEADRQAEIFEQIIDAQPTIEERKEGKWRIGKQIGPNNVTVYVDECPFCGSQYPFGENNYCPHCGARMEVDDAGNL